MTQTFNESVVVNGVADTTQLEVKGNATQTQPLQSWQDNAGDTLAQVTGHGDLELGNNLGIGAPHDALVQVNSDVTLPSSGATSGWHTLGRITNALSSVVTWVVHEVQLLGSAGVSGLQTVMRAKLTHSNTGNSTNAELRAIDAQSINQTGTSGARVGQATGLRATASNAASAYLNKAVAVEAAVTNDASGDITEATALAVVPPPTLSGTIGTLYGLRVPDLFQAVLNYAIYTGKGLVHLGDQLGIFGSGDKVQAFIQAYTTQTAALQEWRDSTGTPLALVDNLGNMTPKAYKLPTAVASPLVSDAFTVSQGYHVLSAESGAVDNLATINGGGGNLDLTIQAAAGHTITVKNAAGNIFLNGGADFVLSGDKTLRLFFDTTNWSDIGAGGGNTLRSGSGAPASGLGTDGDYYINTAANTIYGPKASGSWGSPTSIVGPTGATGAAGGTALTTKGDILGYDTAANRHAKGSNEQIIVFNSNQADNLENQWPPFGMSGRLTPSPTLPSGYAGGFYSTIYWLPYNGNRVRLRDTDGVYKWFVLPDAGYSLSLSGSTAYCMHDVFARIVSGTPTLDFTPWVAPYTASISNISTANPPIATMTAPHTFVPGNLVNIAGTTNGLFNTIGWRVGVVTSTTVQLIYGDGSNPGLLGGAGGGTMSRFDQNTARATPIDPTLGFYEKHGDNTRLYLGSFYSQASGTCYMQPWLMFLWNYFNRIPWPMTRIETTASWAYTSAAWRPLHNDSYQNRLQFIIGVDDVPIQVALRTFMISSAAQAYIGLSLDNTSAPVFSNVSPSMTAKSPVHALFHGFPGVGYHFMQAMEYGAASGYTSYGNYFEELYGDILS